MKKTNRLLKSIDRTFEILLAWSIVLSLSSLPVLASTESFDRSLHEQTLSQGTEEDATDSSTQMYRLYNPNSSEHFYTADLHEKNALISYGWPYEGIGWFAPQSGEPVYRLYNPNAGDHHYTLNLHERDALVQLGWRYEKIGWYSDTQKRVPVYREYNPNAKSGAHNFTTSRQEDQALVRFGWKAEGIAWYAVKEGVPVDRSLKALHVSGTQLLDENNQEVVLQGFSTFGLNYMPQYVNENVFRFLYTQMNSRVIRLALYTQEYGGYCSGGNQTELKAIIDRGVKAAKATGQYVIIDWHILSDGNPNQHIDQAKVFFDEMSAKYASEKHVLYEICNEPNGTDWASVKAYANTIIPIIRRHDPDAVILVGTPTWSQDVDVAARDPLQGYSNIMYTQHFYAATHKEPIRDKLKTAHALGLPVFVTEFGISSADGNGTIDPASGNAWIALLNEYGISRVGWALSDKNETSALFKPGTTTSLSLSDLTPSGEWFYETYTHHYPAHLPNPNPGLPQPSDPVEPDLPKPDTPSSGQSGFLNWSLKTINSWSENGEYYVQYELTLTNKENHDVNGWKAEIPLNQDFRVQSGWNAVFSQNGRTLIVQNESYNASIGAGQSIGGIGIILRSSQLWTS